MPIKYKDTTQLNTNAEERSSKSLYKCLYMSSWVLILTMSIVLTDFNLFLFFRVLPCVFVVFCVSVYSVYCLSSMDLCGLN